MTGKARTFGIAVASALLLAASSSASPRDDAEALATRMEGVYKHRFESGMVGGDGEPATVPVMVEDVVEVVRHAPQQIYFRAALNFFNGHACGIHGIATFDNGAFVYRSSEFSDSDEPPCTLRIAVRGAELVLDDRTTSKDEDSCHSYCGTRGTLSDYRIEMKRKRPIRYLERLKASRQYKEAVEALSSPCCSSTPRSP
jgi:hypothetical protein